MGGQRETFIFYRSFYDAITDMPEEYHAIMFKAIFEYSLNNNPIELTGICKTIFTLIKPILDANNKRFENGKKGGRGNKKETEQKPKQNQNKTKIKPNENLTETKIKPNENLTETKTEANNNYNKDNNNNYESEEEVEPNPYQHIQPTPPINNFQLPYHDGSYLPIDQCRELYDQLHAEKKNNLCYKHKLNAEQFTKLQNEFDLYVKTTTSSKIVKDYISHFARWMDKPHAQERITVIKKGEDTPEMKRLKHLGLR